jgi:membrane dipeptidase
METGLNACERESLAEMERLGILPDLSHVNPATKDEIIQRTKRPIIASHIGVKSVFDMAWNITDEQIEAVAAKEGVLGIACLPFFLNMPATVMDFVDHVEYVQNLVGIDYVGIGADFIDYEPSYAHIEFTRDLEDTTKVQNITRALVARGFTRKEIAQVLGENFLRVISEGCG